MASEAIPKRLKSWLVASIAVLLVSLLLLAGTVAAGFFYFADMNTPMWVSVVGAVSMLGSLAGFAGLFVLLIVGDVMAGRGDKRQAPLQH